MLGLDGASWQGLVLTRHHIQRTTMAKFVAKHNEHIVVIIDCLSSIEPVTPLCISL